MNKYIKKMALKIPQVKKVYRNIEQLRSEICKHEAEKEQLRSQIENLSSLCESRLHHIEHQQARNNFVIKQLSDLFDDNVERSWSSYSSRKKYICMQPFTRVDVNMGGDIRTCCPDWLKYGCSLGNGYINTFDEIWNSDIVKKIRYGVSEGNYEYCNQRYCPVLNHPEKFPNVMKKRTGGGGV